MSMTPAVWALAGAALFAVAPARAQTAAPTVLPCAGETPRTFEPPVNRGAQDDPADWSQEQVNAQPKGEQMRDNATYRRQVTALYQQHLAVYAGQLRKFADDKALHEQFKAGFNGAKLAVAQQANANIARGAEPV